VELCDACRACEVACAQEHAPASDIDVADLPDEPGAAVSGERGLRLHVSAAYLHFERCLQCTDAPCVSACPNGAMCWDAELGVVYVDQDRCQGCLMCAAACPFGVISMHPTRGVALKCDGCRDRAHRGRPPACVEACETGALRLADGRGRSRRQRAIARELADAICLSGNSPLVRTVRASEAASSGGRPGPAAPAEGSGDVGSARRGG
jgi:carbon-monoxide dehydrogenase iron sulfur subunit